jgi:hypothetical protein
MSEYSRRNFLKQTACIGAAALAASAVGRQRALAADKPGSAIKFGLVTYQWGRDWDLPTLIKNCQTAGLPGVELRTTHAHGVEPKLNPQQRAEVKKRFDDSPIKLLSLGTIEEFHSPDPKILAQAIENTKAWVKLGHDVGSTGIKVRPNALPKEIPAEKTIEQIGKSLNVLGAFAADYGQQIRLEIHGGCARIPIIKQVIDVANHPNVALCWNSNDSDQEPPGLEHNFNLVKTRLGFTTHVRELNTPGYDWQALMNLFVKSDYKGWWLLEAGGKDPADRVAALIQQRGMFEAMKAKAMG